MSFGIGIFHGKYHVNIGTLYRSAFCFGASFIYTIGRRYTGSCADTPKSWRHIPLLNFKTFEDFKQHIPYSWVPVAMEITDDAIPLERFNHPSSAIYILGQEDGSLRKDVLNWCAHTVKINTKICLNVSMAGTALMYDRSTKIKDFTMKSELASTY